MPEALQRFVTAQDAVWPQVQRELAAGRKTSHWMWFVFPQLRGLGRSETASYYGVDGLDEARAYLAHPVLGPRLHKAVGAALASGEEDPTRVFGSPDDLKFRSCLTLFLTAASEPADRALFASALEQYFGGAGDDLTMKLLGAAAG